MRVHRASAGAGRPQARRFTSAHHHGPQVGGSAQRVEVTLRSALAHDCKLLVAPGARLWVCTRTEKEAVPLWTLSSAATSKTAKSRAGAATSPTQDLWVWAPDFGVCGGGRNIGRAESGTTNNVSSPHRPPTEWAERRLARTHDYDWHVHRADFDVRALVRHLASGSVHFRSPARSQICASGSVRLVACALANMC